MTTLQPDKGIIGGSCNRTACQKPGAVWRNTANGHYYCEECALLLNDAAGDQMVVREGSDGDGFHLWDGNYRKMHYDVRLPDGTVEEHLWPNAGTFIVRGKFYKAEDGISIRPSANQGIRNPSRIPAPARRAVRIELDGPGPVATKLAAAAAEIQSKNETAMREAIEKREAEEQARIAALPRQQRRLIERQAAKASKRTTKA